MMVDRVSWKICAIIPAEVLSKLRALMPADWIPPFSDERPITTNFKLEGPEELEKIMRKRPHHPKGVGSRG